MWTSMSANILDGITPTLVSGASSSDDVISIAANAGGERNVVKYAISGLEVLSANQTMHIGISLRAESGGDEWTSAVVVYRDSANNIKARSNFVSSTGDGAWHRHSMGVTVPSGMTIVGINFNQKASGTAIDFANPVFSYGSTGIVMAAGSVTVASINDVASTTRWYLIQASTLTAPAAPTASPPGGSWQTTEPTYTEGSTNSLYFVDETIFSDGTWAYSSVSLSTSYEAAKAAYNKAAAAAAAAAATAQHFWADDSGAHISSTGDHDTSGFHQLMTSVKNAFMHGNTELMTISENLIELGKNSPTSIIKLCDDMLRMQYWSDKNLFELAANYGEADTHQNLALSFFNKTTGDFDERGAGLEFIPVGVNNHTAAEMCFWILCDTLQINVSNIRIGSEEYPISRLATAIQPVVLYNGGAALTYDTAPGAGVQGTVPLSESAANFHEITVIYKTDDNAWGENTVIFPDGKHVDIGPSHPAGSGQANDVYLKGATYAISGTSMTRQAYINMGVHNGSTAVIAGDVITVVRVEGRR